MSEIALYLVLGFLGLSLLIGLKAGSKVKTIEDYVLANRNVSTAGLVLTYMATMTGASWLFSDTSHTYDYGIVRFLATLGLSISYFLQSYFFSSKMHRFKECLSMGDILKKIYGEKAGFFGGLVSITATTLFLSGQLKAIGFIFENFLGYHSYIGIFAFGVVLAIYASLGGIKSVTSTDIFQVILVFVMMIMISNAIVAKIGGVDVFLKSIPKSRLIITSSPTFISNLSLFIMWSFFSSVITSPPIMQRVLMVNTRSKFKRMFISIGSFDIILKILLLIVSLGSVILWPKIAGKDVVSNILDNLFDKNLRAFLIICILSLVMSTADSHMSTGGINFIVDFLPKKKDNLRYVRISTVSISILAMFFAVYKTSLLMLSTKGIQVAVSTICVPLVLGIYGLRPSKRAFWYACGVSSSTFIMCLLILSDKFAPLAPVIAATANLITFLAVHIWEFGGVKMAEDANLAVESW